MEFKSRHLFSTLWLTTLQLSTQSQLIHQNQQFGIIKF